MNQYEKKKLELFRALFVLPCRRAALEKWKQQLGDTATYNNLIRVFELAGYQGYADTVRKIASNM